MDTIILASKSPRRREILSILEIPFIVFEPQIEEIVDSNSRKVVSLVTSNSRRKAISVAEYFTNGLILGVDTVVVVLNRIIGKPSDEEEARKFLHMLSGNRHTVYSGVTVLDVKTGRIISGISKTDVIFKKLSREEIDYYIGTNEWVDKAGGYAIQKKAAFFVKSIIGSYYNVVGLPVETLYEILMRFDYFTANGQFHPLRKL